MYISYDREKAVAYAHQWATGRNPDYTQFDRMGGDCTNFISQCLFAGCGVMNYTPETGWFYLSLARRSPAWSGVPFLYNFLVGTHNTGPYGRELPLDAAQPGDVVQLSFDGVKYGHSLFVVAAGDRPGETLVTTHSFDCDNRPLSSYTYEKCRLIHIDGAYK